MKKRNPNFRMATLPIVMTFLLSTGAIAQEFDTNPLEAIRDNTYVAPPVVKEIEINGLDKDQENKDQEKKDELVADDNKDQEKKYQEIKDQESKDELVANDNQEVNKIKNKISELENEIKELTAKVLESKVISSAEKEELEKRANSLKSELEKLMESSNNLADYEGCEEDEKILKELINESITKNNEIIRIIAELDAKEIEIIDDKKEEDVIAEKDEKIKDLENYICKQENKLEELENQVTTISQQAMQPVMMQMMMMQMMQQQMMMMSQFQMAPSVLDRTDHFNSMMMMSAINNMNTTNNLGMMGMMNVIGGLGQQQNPSLYVGGNMYSGDYTYGGPVNPMAHFQAPANYYPTPSFGYNFDNSNRATPGLNTNTANDVNLSGTGLDG